MPDNIHTRAVSVDTGPDFVTVDGGHSYTIEDGQLTVLDEHRGIRATFAPGRWTYAIIEEGTA